MSFESVDLTRGGEGNIFSPVVTARAEDAIAEGRVTMPGNKGYARCQSRTSARIWLPVANLGPDRQVLGITCNCPNGRQGGALAGCWHACALSILLGEGAAENPQE